MPCVCRQQDRYLCALAVSDAQRSRSTVAGNSDTRLSGKGAMNGCEWLLLSIILRKPSGLYWAFLMHLD